MFSFKIPSMRIFWVWLSETGLWNEARPGSSFSGSLDHLLLSHPSHEQNLASTPNRVEVTAKGVEQQPWSFWHTFTPIEYGKSSNYSLSDLAKGSMPYEPLFDLALPKVASLFLERKTTEAIRRAEEESEHREEVKREDLSSTSPSGGVGSCYSAGTWHPWENAEEVRFCSSYYYDYLPSVLEEMRQKSVLLFSCRTPSSQSQSADHTLEVNSIAIKEKVFSILLIHRSPYSRCLCPPAFLLQLSCVRFHFPVTFL